MRNIRLKRRSEIDALFAWLPTRISTIVVRPQLAATLSLSLVAGCQSIADRVSEHEDALATAGFVIRLANTPERQDMLRRLPPHVFVRRIHDDAVHYVYADPLVCDCLYVGTQQAYSQYRQNELNKRLADEAQMTAQEYDDASWNWHAWGPWSHGYHFRYGPGYGW